MSPVIFAQADKSLMVIYREMAKEFHAAGTSLGFDELNVLETRKSVKAMYQRLDAIIQREYRKICREAYIRACREAHAMPKDFDPYEFVYAMLHDYDPLSDFVYTREWARKRDRLFESIIATQRGNQEMRKNLKRNMDVLANQVRQYADNTVTLSRIKAFKDAKVKYVKWVTEKDERVCDTCLQRAGVVYPINALPDIPAHWRCRCHLVIATEEEYLAQQSALFSNPNPDTLS